MKQLIVLSGRSNVGKSRTIKKVYELLLSKYPNAKVMELYETRIEVKVVVTINGKRIGIASKGDRRELMNPALNLFAEYKCQIILCATRTRGGTCDVVQEYAAKRGYEVNRIEKIPEQNVAQQDNSNKKFAVRIVKEIDRFL